MSKHKESRISGSARAVNEKLLNICQRMGQTGILNKAYLGGGTGLALQINHRVSVDLDFFLVKDTALNSESLIRMVEATFGAGVAVDFRSGDQLDLLIDGMKVSFIAYPFKPVEPLIAGEQIMLELSGLFLASPPEIALMKAYAIGRRAVFRDYVDMYVLLKDSYVSLGYIQEMAAQKFILQNETVFSMKLFLQQLAYTADAGSEEEKESAVNMLLLDRIAPEEIQKYLAKSVKDFTLKKLTPKAPGGLKL
ncbi:MAG: hypothetical protein DDT21_02194 [Syntrophomonadaceae bacterium]|nr:hypothetical protein [Bacillota bacterium]